MALSFFESWRAELPRRISEQDLVPGSQAARELQQEAEELLESLLNLADMCWEANMFEIS